MDVLSISRILREIQNKEDVVVVGGQAIVAWARYFASAPEFGPSEEPVTTRDVDLLGTVRRARELATATRASIAVPGPDDHSPNSAVLDLGSSKDEEERIDFLHYVKGAGDTVAKQAVIIEVPDPADVHETIRIRIMHPMHCLQSKLANTKELHRTGDLARSQLEATTPILREFISAMLDAARGDSRSIEARAAFKSIDRLGEYLERDIIGRHAGRLMTRDPLAILESLLDDDRLPPEFREHNVANCIGRIRDMRAKLRPALSKGPSASSQKHDAAPPMHVGVRGDDRSI